MDAFGFVLKSLVVTCLLVVVLQVRFGNATLEDHTMSLLTESAVIQPLNGIAHNAVVATRNGWNSFLRMIDTNFTSALREENRPGSRHLRFGFSRDFDSERKKIREAVEKYEAHYRGETKAEKHTDDTDVPSETRE